jgi:hypothetical protein
VLDLRDGTRKNWQALITYTNLHKTNTKWLVHSWNTFGARTSHRQFELTRLTTTRTWGSHHLPLYSIFCNSSTGATSKWFFVPKFPQLGLLQLRRCITWRANLWLWWGLKQGCSPCWELSNGMWYVAYTPPNWVNSQLLVVGSQIASLTPDLSFAHNLCFRCPNGECEPILDIYISIDFQWYKELFEVMGFDPCNHALRIWKSIWDSNSQHGSSFVSVRVHSLTLIALREHVMWLSGLSLGPQPCNPAYFGCEPKA